MGRVLVRLGGVGWVVEGKGAGGTNDLLQRRLVT